MEYCNAIGADAGQICVHAAAVIGQAKAQRCPTLPVQQKSGNQGEPLYHGDVGRNRTNGALA